MILELKQNIFARAKVFIEELNEFAPFGAKYADHKIIDVMYDSEESEEIDSQQGIEKLADSLSDDIKRGKAQSGAIAFDVVANFKNSDGVSEKRDALCLRITTDGIEWNDEYFPYMIIDGECVWR